jgi:diguanylate cyclase (GGDEF)-like protein
MKLSAITRITLGLVSLFVCLILLFDLVFKLFPNEQDQQRELRRRSSEHLAIQTAVLAQGEDLVSVERTLKAVKARDGELLSLGLRRADGSLLASAGPHAQNWGVVRNDKDLAAHEVLVPLINEGKRWGALEISYRGGLMTDLFSWITSKPIQLVALVGLLGSGLVYLYLRRVLVHLDPSSAVPDRVRMAFDTLTESVMVVDVDGRIVMANDSLRALRNPNASKSDHEPLIGKRPSELSWLVSQLDPDPKNHPWNRAIATRQPVKGTPLACQRVSGEQLELMVNCAPVTDSNGAVRGCIVTIDNVTQLVQAHQQLLEVLTELAASKDQLQSQNGELQRLASRDPLTGCLNRRSFMAAFERLFDDAGKRDLKLACFMVDIDKFKNINDTMGHAVGDKAIQSLARVLSQAVRQTDLVCRYGGEEFCIVMPGLDLARAQELAERIRASVEAICGPETAGRPDYRVTTSLGVSMLDAGATTAAALLDQADQALYIAKQTGRNKVVNYDPQPQPQAQEEFA